MPDLLLAADVGGTNTRLRLVDAAAPAVAIDEHTYGDALPVDAAVAAFLERLGDRRRNLGAACFGVAGRVVDGDVRMTNRPSEVITDDRLAVSLGLETVRVRVVNDMERHLSGVDVSESVALRLGMPIGNVEGMVMPGTGLGVGYAVWFGHRRHAQASEGGHLDFGPPSAAHDGLLTWARRQTPRVSWEWLVSGPGLARIYAFYDPAVKDDPVAAGRIKPKEVAAASFGEPTCLDANVARRAAVTFLELAGARAGNLALDTLATQAIYFGGNILIGMHARDPSGFTRALSASLDACGPEALRETLANVPLHLVRSNDSGLRGAAVLARELI